MALTNGNKFLIGLRRSLNKETHIAALAVLRMAFGFIMAVSTIRFVVKGWVYEFYVAPKFHFPFYGFEWLRPLSAPGLYCLFALLMISSLFVMMGFFYRVSIVCFFICFVYIELLDKTYYLNHYYFVSLISFLLLIVPAHRYFSLDIVRKPSLKITRVPGWTINIFKWQLCLVYFFAGISKLNYEWLIEATPLKIWLPAHGNMPVVGAWLQQTWVAYLFSWFGAIFDLSIGFLLLNKNTRRPAYFFVLVFHVFTGWLFKIGMFPYIMIFVTIIFFSESFHLRVIKLVRSIFKKHSLQSAETALSLSLSGGRRRMLYSLLAVYMLMQVLLPFRYLFYPGKLFWTEEGYRFSWRVMLMEKSGIAFFYVADRRTGRRGEVVNSEFLTSFQERMMETQPDMILQYAHHLHDVYQNRGIDDPVVTVESHVTLNGNGSRLYADSSIDLSRQKESFLPVKWILPFHHNN